MSLSYSDSKIDNLQRVDLLCSPAVQCADPQSTICPVSGLISKAGHQDKILPPVWEAGTLLIGFLTATHTQSADSFTHRDCISFLTRKG